MRSLDRRGPPEDDVDMYGEMWDCFQAIPEEFGSEEAASYWAQEGSGIQVEILTPDSKRGMKHFVNDLESYMTSQTKKRGVEVSERRLDPRRTGSVSRSQGRRGQEVHSCQSPGGHSTALQPDRRTAMKMRWFWLIGRRTRFRAPQRPRHGAWC